MPDEKLPEQLETHQEEIIEYVERYSPRPTVDTELARRILDEAPPVQAAEELEQLIDGFRDGSGAATGPRSMPAAEDPPTDRLDPSANA